MKKYGRLYQEAEITLSNDEWDETDRERVLSDAETLLFERIGKVTDAVEIDGKINTADNSIVFMVNFHNNGTCEFYPGDHNFDGKQEDINEVEVTDPEDTIQEQLNSLEYQFDCDVYFLTINKEWKED